MPIFHNHLLKIQEYFEIVMSCRAFAQYYLIQAKFISRKYFRE
jgi:hypothetical protein